MPSPLRRTLARPAEFRGVALHSGKDARMRLLPAEPESGVVFRRTDAGGAEIPATIDCSGPSFYATVLERDGVSVSTIEHLMAALYALQVDDALVEIDGPELPILDGSSGPFVEGIERAGTADSAVERRFITLIRPVVVTHQDKRVAAYPASEYRVTYAIDFDHPLLGYQELSCSVWRHGAFARKLAWARTFTFEEEVEALRARGLALGGSLDNALVLSGDRLLNDRLRYPDEFVRHKMLDLIGDLALLGHPLRAHVVAYRAGHDLHAKLARRIAESPDAWYLAPLSDRPSRLTSAAEL